MLSVPCLRRTGCRPRRPTRASRNCSRWLAWPGFRPAWPPRPAAGRLPRRSAASAARWGLPLMRPFPVLGFGVGSWPAPRSRASDTMSRGARRRSDRTLLFQGLQAPLDRPDAGGPRCCRSSSSMMRGVLPRWRSGSCGSLRSSGEQALVVGEAEGDREHPGLGVVEVEQADQQGRPQLDMVARSGRSCSPSPCPTPPDRRQRAGPPQQLARWLNIAFSWPAAARPRGHLSRRPAGSARPMRLNAPAPLQGQRFAGAGGAGDKAVGLAAARQRQPDHGPRRCR